MDDGLGEDGVEGGGDVGLDKEEEQLLEGNRQDCRAEDGVGRVAPDLVGDEIRVPGDRCDDRDLQGEFEVSRRRKRDSLETRTVMSAFVLITSREVRMRRPASQSARATGKVQ